MSPSELVLLPRVAFRGREITGARLHGLLALLAAELRTGCSTARLVDGLWAEGRPEHPTKALQVLVSRARTQLGPGVIASTATGYRLALAVDQVDAAAVLACVSAAGRHARESDHAGALTAADEGLAHLDGAAADVEGGPLADLRADRAGARFELERARALALARLGRRAEALGELARVAGRDPRDEEVLAELLRCEPPAAALARYDAHRRALRDELGADPGPELQAAHQRLLQGEAPEVRRGVAHDPNPLLGRAEDIAAVTALLHSSRVTSIVGAGGLGKTRLAHVVSREADLRVVHFVGLAGIAEDADVAAEVASALGVGDVRGPTGSMDLLSGLVDALSGGPVLLVLDNCEHVVDGAAELVRALVAMVRDLRVLTTSRTPLGLSSESVYLLPELALPTAVELFGQRARAARPGVELPAATVGELGGHLDGLPLAVELAAARVRVMSVSEIARRLDDRFALLRGGPRDAPARHRTLQAVVDWSWNLLSDAEQAAMRALSVFPGGFSADAAGHVLADVDVLEHLVDQSLLTVTDGPSGARFRMLETVREFSSAHRERAGDTARATDGLLSWARDFGVAQHEAPFGPGPFSALGRIRADQDNLLHALRLGVDREDGATVAATSAVLASMWTAELNNGRVLRLIAESSRVLSHFRPEPPFVDVTRTAAALFAAHSLMLHGPRATRAMVVLRRLPPVAPSNVIRATAAVLAALPAAMAEPDRSGLQALCDSTEPLVAGIADVVACYVWNSEGELDLAMAAARRMASAVGDRSSLWTQIVSHSMISDMFVQVERGDEALHHANAAVDQLEELGAWAGTEQFRWSIVMAHMVRGDVDEAARVLARGIPEQSEDEPSSVPYILGVEAEIDLARGETDAGLLRWRHAVAGLERHRPAALGAAAGNIELMSAAVLAHVRHGRPDLAEDVRAELREQVHAVLADPAVELPSYLLGFPVFGAALLALGAADGGSDGARMIAMADRVHFVRNFQPTMTDANARWAAERADAAAYTAAASEFATLRRDDIRAVMLGMVRG